MANTDGKTSGHCVISAHGGPANAFTGRVPRKCFYPSFTVPANMYFIFFGPHEKPLLDPNYRNVLLGAFKPYEVFGPGSLCHNYGLWKYQGYHDHAAAGYLGKIAQPFVKPGAETYESILQYYVLLYQINITYSLTHGEVVIPKDMLTIRYRPFQVHTTLAELISELRLTRANDYRYFHCNFCRGMSGEHDAKSNKDRPVQFWGTKPPADEFGWPVD